ncbi:hypothetical protein CP061683_0860B, partial [Chlamydia psittaci 06-1683]
RTDTPWTSPVPY